jgi:hypothetical protein
VNSKPLFIRACLIFLILCSAPLYGDHEKSHLTQDGPPPRPEFQIVDKWRGTWDVKATRLQPQPPTVVTFVETFEWILDGRFLRSETSRKSDGNKSMSMIWYDINTKVYRFVIFDSTAFAVELPPPTWNEGTQTMEWKSGLFSSVSFTGRVTFTDRDTMRWKSVLKDWKGTVVLDLEGTSIRRK